jgi:hypothetical protein
MTLDVGAHQKTLFFEPAPVCVYLFDAERTINVGSPSDLK